MYKQVNDRKLQCLSVQPCQGPDFHSSFHLFPFHAKEKTNKHNSHFFCHIVYHKSMNFRWRSFIWKRKRKEFCGGKNVSMFILLVRIFLDILKLKIRIFSSFHDSFDSRQNKTFFLYPWKKNLESFFFQRLQNSNSTYHCSLWWLTTIIITNILFF